MKRYGLFFWDIGLCQSLLSELFTVEIRFSATVINYSFLADRQIRFGIPYYSDKLSIIMIETTVFLWKIYNKDETIPIVFVGLNKLNQFKSHGLT